MKMWLKEQFLKRRWTVITACLVLFYLLVVGALCLFYTDNLNTAPLLFQGFVLFLFYWLIFGALPILVSSILGLVSKDKIGKVWCAAFLLLDLFPLWCFVPKWGEAFLRLGMLMTF